MRSEHTVMNTAKMTLAIAAIAAMGMVAAAQAMPAGKGLGGAQTIEMEGGGIRHLIVSECYLTKVCAKWGGGHICHEWTQKKVCGPPINASKAPPRTPTRINKRL